MRISDWSSDVCSSDLLGRHPAGDLFLKIGRCPGHEDGEQQPAEQQPRPGVQPRHRLPETALHSLPPTAISSQSAAPATSPAATRPIHSFATERTAKAAMAIPAKIAKDSRPEAHTSELQSLIRTSYAAFGLTKK